MANMPNKDFNAMLNDSKDMPKIKIITDEISIKKYGGSRMLLAPPIEYDKLMKEIPKGKVVTVNLLRNHLAKKYGADFADPLTAGIFISIVAWASEQRDGNKTPYWRTLKSGGELNPKYPGGVDRQKDLLVAEGHTIASKGRKNIRYYVVGCDKEQVCFDETMFNDSEAKQIKKWV